MDLISRQAAIDAIREDADWLESQGSDWQTERRERDFQILAGLPSAQQTISCGHENDHSAEVSKKIVPCEDAVSRQAAIDGIRKDVMGGLNYKRILNSLPAVQPEITEEDVKEYCRKRCLIVLTSDFYEEMMKRWSSTQPERKKGKWINHRSDEGHNIADCDQCGETMQWYDPDPKPNFCPNCGSYNREEGGCNG